MDAETVESIAKLAKQAAARTELTQPVSVRYDGEVMEYEFKIDATEHGPVIGDRIAPLRPSALQVETLTGFVDAVKAGVGGKIDSRVVHVEDYLTVKMLAAEPDAFGVRNIRLCAKHKPPGIFEFDAYMAPEKFLIGMQTCFLNVDGGDWDYVMRVASNLKAGETVHSQDDGINQSVTLRTGSVEAAEINIKPRVKLCTIRTFYEVEPVISEFLLRLRPNPQNQLPLLALFATGGTRWQGETMLAIKHYLHKNLPAGTVILA